MLTWHSDFISACLLISGYRQPAAAGVGATLVESLALARLGTEAQTYKPMSAPPAVVIGVSRW